MAIDTDDKKLALMEWDVIWEPGIPLDETAAFDQGDKQQLLWGYPGILWGEPTEVVEPPPTGGFYRRISRREREFLRRLGQPMFDTRAALIDLEPVAVAVVRDLGIETDEIDLASLDGLEIILDKVEQEHQELASEIQLILTNIQLQQALEIEMIEYLIVTVLLI